MDSVDEDEEDLEAEADTLADIDKVKLSRDGLLGTNAGLEVALERSEGPATFCNRSVAETAGAIFDSKLLTERGLGASLKSMERGARPRFVLPAAMVFRYVEGRLIVALGLVRPLDWPLPPVLDGELVGLGKGSRERCAAGGVLTGKVGIGGFKDFLVGFSCLGLGIESSAPRVLGRRIDEAGKLGGPMDLAALEIFDSFLGVLAGDGEEGSWDKV